MSISIESLSKESLRSEFSKNPDQYYGVGLFEREGFDRHRCKSCGKNFWSAVDTDSCGDSSHTEYTFFKERPRKVNYVDFWKEFSGFFKKNGHTEVARYPTVSRWRRDLYFTIASIQDFQRIENGKMSFEYPVNPLIVPQMCLRFNDIENVGVTGRHFSSFMMGGQQSFNYPEEGYWKDRTIELNFNYLTKVLAVKKEDLRYIEDVWAMGDFSEFGPSLESFANGAELVNSVFTQFEYVGGKIHELEGKVVDVGWGFERLMWYYGGSDSAFETVFHDVIEGLRPKVGFEIDGRLFRKFSAVSSEIDIMEKRGRTREYALLKKAGISKEDYEKSIKPTQAFYAILDHARTLLFAITDGALPSNIGGGYNLRIILRRALGFIDEYGLKFDLDEVAALEAEELKRLFPELSDSMGLFSKVIDIEKGRFARTKENAGRIIEGMLSKSKSIDAKRLRTLYESNGITPDLIENTAARKGIKVDMPESSYEDILKGDFVAKEKGKGIDMDVHGIDKTEQLYYKLAEESESNVLKSEKNYLVLDRTPFYPEGGGQEADNGTINGHKVEDVQRVGDVIVHIMKENIDGKKDVHPGSKVHCIVDRERRRRLMVHHTSTHLMSAAARSVLGKHAWQEGTRKSFDKAHIDVAHYDKLGSEDVRMLEQFVNSKLFGGIKVTVKYMDRKDAEGKYGFEIYQGHGVPSHTMRMVIIEGMDGGFIDAEACGGLHVAGMEQAIGMIKIIDTERISDGVDRIVFVAGDAALDYFRNVSNVLSDAALKLNTEQSRVVERIELIGEENRKARKQMQEYKEAMAENIATSIASSSETETEIDLPKDVLRLIATKAVGINASAVVLLCNKAGEAVCITGDKSVVSALDFIKSRAKGFTGGGNKKFAEGKIA